MTRKQKWAAVLIAPPALIFLVVMGLFAYVTATIDPLHPDPKAVPTGAPWTPVQKWAPAVEQGRQIARASISEQNLPGLSIAVGINGEIVWADGFGWADVEKKAPVKAETQFRIGGTSIPLTSAAVGLLLEKNLLKLDDEIQTYVPEYPRKDWPVTLRHLMANVSGIRGDNQDEESMGERCERPTDALPRFADASLRFEPGSQYKYSTYGWVLVSAAVEKAGGEPFFEFMKSKVFEPLGMRDTVKDEAAEPLPDRATFYFPRFAADTRYGHDAARAGDYCCLAGAAGYLSTPSDLVRFAMGLNSGKLLKPETVKLLQSPQRLTSGAETGYALGWDIENVTLAGAAARHIGHDDEFVIGGSSSLIAFPDRGLVVAVTTNTSFAKTAEIAVRIAEAFAAQK